MAQGKGVAYRLIVVVSHKDLARTVCVSSVFFVDINDAGRPGSSEVLRNPLTRWDVSSTPANGLFLSKNKKQKQKCPVGGERLNRWYTNSTSRSTRERNG